MKYAPIVKATNEILAQYKVRLTIRQIYYRIISPPYQLFANLMKNYKQFDRVLTRAREKGDVNWRLIEDRARGTLGGDFGYDGVGDFLDTSFDIDEDQYTRKMWEDQPSYVEVWLEKDALASLVSNVARNYRVLTFPSRGYSSLTKIAEAICERFYDRFITLKPVLVLHFTDHDPSGLDMSRDAEARVKDYFGRMMNEETFIHLRRDHPELSHDEVHKLYEEKIEEFKRRVVGKGWSELFQLKRIALTYDQVKKFDLAPNPTKMICQGRESYVSQFGDECWELDALPPDELERIVDEAVNDHIDQKAWNKTAREIENEKKAIAGALKDEKKTIDRLLKRLKKKVKKSE
jgi:hypothetical protein